MRAAAITALLLSASLGCTPDEPASDTPAIEPAEPEAPDEPRAPHGAGPAGCSEGSDDPPEIARLEQLANAGAVDRGVEGLEAIVGAHPASATARVRLGELLLRTRPPRAEAAQRWFGRAIELHESGCELSERDLWAALEGAGLSRMMAGDYAGARPWLERSLARWPDVRSTHYNLACARCQSDDLDGCASALEAVFAPGEDPAFLEGAQHPIEHYRDLARRDPDLAPLREDAARFEAIVAAP